MAVVTGASWAVGTALGSVEGLLRSVYSLGEIAKHAYRARTIKDYDTIKLEGCAYANPVEVRSAYWQQVKRGVMELVLPILASLGWFIRDYKQEIKSDEVSATEGKKWWNIMAQIMEGPEMRKLNFCEEVINDILNPTVEDGGEE